MTPDGLQYLLDEFWNFQNVHQIWSAIPKSNRNHWKSKPASRGALSCAPQGPRIVPGSTGRQRWSIRHAKTQVWATTMTILVFNNANQQSEVIKGWRQRRGAGDSLTWNWQMSISCYWSIWNSYPSFCRFYFTNLHHVRSPIFTQFDKNWGTHNSQKTTTKNCTTHDT